MVFGRKRANRPQNTSAAAADDKNTHTPGLPAPGKAIRVEYKFNDVPIPDDFLVAAPPDARPVTAQPIDWAQTALPERKGLYACVLDHVLSPSECETLLRLAEASVPDDFVGKVYRDRSWQPALVNMGGGWEVLEPGYRNSDRIIWDRQEVVDRLWERCLEAPGVRDRLAVIEDDREVLGPARTPTMKRRWEMKGLNKRMRFLKYGEGQFFLAHNDSAYREEVDDRIFQTHFTVHLYLNDSKQAVGGDAELVGGATSFLSSDEKRKIDVDPKAGRVLIFQHRGLYHSGAEVERGIKYTMRSDLLYELTHREK